MVVSSPSTKDSPAMEGSKSNMFQTRMDPDPKSISRSAPRRHSINSSQYTQFKVDLDPHNSQVDAALNTQATRKFCTSSLCNDCLMLDLRGAMQRLAEKLRRKADVFRYYINMSGPDYCQSVRVARVGLRYRSKPTNGCQLCSMLFRSRVTERQSCSEDYLYLFPFYTFEPSLCFGEDDDGSRRVVIAGLAVIPQLPSSPDSFNGFEINHQLRARGFPILFKEEHQPQYSEISRPSQPVIICEEIRECLETCKSKHSLCRKESSQPMPLLLVDCRDRSLKQNLSTEDDYVALSYVWGQVTIHQLDDGRLPQLLPQTIEDAIELTLALGYHYLWVDQFCINQDDPAKKHEQIRSMGHIYGKAELTLVAACGDDANHGLPGVTSHPREQYSSLWLDGCIVQSYQGNNSAAVTCSTWNNRGWTFQEGYLSRRLLFIGTNEFVYQCRDAVHSESCLGPWNWEVKNGLSRWNSSYRFDTAPFIIGDDEEFGHDEGSNFWMRYAIMVRKFWGRSLRFDDDAVIACTAGLEHLKAQWKKGLWRTSSEDSAGLTFVHGMPLIVPRSDGKRRSQELRMWADCLKFRLHEVEVRRRESFPSWSWAGYAALDHSSTRGSSLEIPYEVRVDDSNPVIEDISFASPMGNYESPSMGSFPALSAQGLVEVFETLATADLLVLKSYAIPHDLFNTNREDPFKTEFCVTTSEFYIDCSDRRLPAEVIRRQTAYGAFDVVIITASHWKSFDYVQQRDWRAQCLLFERVGEMYHQRVGYAVVSGRSPKIMVPSDICKPVFEDDCTLQTWLVK